MITFFNLRDSSTAEQTLVQRASNVLLVTQSWWRVRSDHAHWQEGDLLTAANSTTFNAPGPGHPPLSPQETRPNIPLQLNRVLMLLRPGANRNSCRIASFLIFLFTQKYCLFKNKTPPPTPLLQTFTNKKSKNTSGIFYSPWTDETFSFSVIATHLLASVFRTASCSLSVTAVDYTPSTVRAEENCSRNRMTSWLQHGRALFLKVTSCCYC